MALKNLVLLVLSGVGVTGDDSRHSHGRGDLAGVDHDQQLHQVVVDLTRTALYDVNVLATNTLAYLHTAYIQ